MGKNSDYKNKLKIHGGGNEGYVEFSMNLMDGWNIIIWNRYLLKSWL